MASFITPPDPSSCGDRTSPTEIECIEVRKVYDLCFQTEQRTRTIEIDDPRVVACLSPNRRFHRTDGPAEGDESIVSALRASAYALAPELRRPSDRDPTLSGMSVPCHIASVSCRELKRTPTSTPGFFDVTFRIEICVVLHRVAGGEHTAEECFAFDQVFVKTVTLCAPDGTATKCSVTGTCDCMIIDEYRHHGCPCKECDERRQHCSRVKLTLECLFDLCLVFKSYAEVNLLVPSFGFCVPAECPRPIGPPCPPAPPSQCEPPTRANDAEG